jgi:hypothetical protein
MQLAMATARTKPATRKTTTKSAVTGTLSERVDAATRRISAWFEKHVPEVAERLRKPAKSTALAALAKALGRPLPPELVAMWLVHDGLPIFEYAGLGAAEAKRRYVGL